MAALARSGRHSIPEGGFDLVRFDYRWVSKHDGLQYVYSVQTLLISLYSLTDIGGGERYTLNTIRAIHASGDECAAYAIVSPSAHPPHLARLATKFVRIIAEEPPQFKEVVTLRDLLIESANYDAVVIHQYLGSDIIFELIANCASDQVVIFTNLGYEPLSEEFATCFQPASKHWFIEISDFSAGRAAKFSKQALSMSAALWRSEITPFQPPQHGNGFGGRLCSVGRLLAHKGFEITMAGIPDDCELVVVGPRHDQAYWKFLQSRRGGKKITFAGSVSDSQKDRIVGEADALIASSHERLYNGQAIEQAELLGLVIFEALALNTLPITSNIGPFQEVMTKLGLADFLYEASNPESLHQQIDYFRSRPAPELAARLEYARQQMIAHYLWDDYWSRVKRAIGLYPTSSF
jgi:glycosyltransferase involved in cell wall biosynthesis